MTITSSKIDERRWRAVIARDGEADGTFVFAVRTTHIHCRPSCGARRPRRQNVVFFATSAEAAAAGFRACKRCRPDAASPASECARVVERVCRHIEARERPPALSELGRIAGYSPCHLQRMFRATIGLSPRAYAAAVRARRARGALHTAPTVTAAVFAAGYESSSRFHADAARDLGMEPRRYRAAGAGECIGFATATCSLGTVLAATTTRGVCAILLGDDACELEADLRRRFARAEFVATDGALDTTLARVIALVDGERTGLGLPLDIRGTAFQCRVWRELQHIPIGSTCSYRDVARRLGAPRATRAVARACAGNPLAVAIPCHRVVHADGRTSGYRWGDRRKRTLLDAERRTKN